MNWLAILAPFLERAAPWLARKLFPDPNATGNPHNPEAARHGAAAGEAARRESKLAGTNDGRDG